MAEKPLPDAVRSLIISKLPSVWQLEILLHLYGARPRYLTLLELAHALRIESEPLLEQLRELHSRGLAVPDAGGETAFAYFSASLEQDQAVAELAATYRERPVSVISLIYARPAEKIRTFADAFRLRQEKEPPS
jgi:hypothetical protein